MNTNNKEALELLRIAKSHVTDGYEASACALIEKCMSLLQDNEDTEVKEEPLLQNNPGHEHLPSGVGEGAYCVGCLEILDKPSSKVEKLKAIKNEVVYTTELHVIKDSLINLLNLLIEDEE